MARKWPNKCMSTTFVWCSLVNDWNETQTHSVSLSYNGHSFARYLCVFSSAFFFTFLLYWASRHISLNVIKILILILPFKCIHFNKAAWMQCTHFSDCWSEMSSHQIYFKLLDGCAFFLSSSAISLMPLFCVSCVVVDTNKRK